MSFGMLFYQKQEPYIASLRHVPYLMITQNFLRPNNGTKRKTGRRTKRINYNIITINNDFLPYKSFNIIFYKNMPENSLI